MVPVLMHTPPTTARDSTTATRFFILEAATAARCPDGPDPMTTRSYLTALMRVSSGTRDGTEPGLDCTSGGYHGGLPPPRTENHAKRNFHQPVSEYALTQ